MQPQACCLTAYSSSSDRCEEPDMPKLGEPAQTVTLAIGGSSHSGTAIWASRLTVHRLGRVEQLLVWLVWSAACTCVLA